MMKSNLFIVAKEGLAYIAFSLLALIIFSIFDLDLFGFLSLLILIFFIYVFRNPEREFPGFEKNSVVSPVDGTVLSIQELQDSEYSYKVEIESSYFDVSILRAPMNSKIETIELINGSRVSKKSKLFKDTNEKAELVFVDENLNKVKVIHILKQSFAPIFINIIKKQNLHQASRYGVAINGVTSIYLPNNFRLNINVGNELKASESLIGYFS